MIIGITGKKGHGKDLVAQMIQHITHFGQLNDAPLLDDCIQFGGDMFDLNHSKFQIKKWAGKLKEITALLLGVSVEKLEDREYKYSHLPKMWWVIKDNDNLLPYNRYMWNLLKENDDCELIKTTPRWFMQNLGTNACRKFVHPFIWVNSLMVDYKPHEVTGLFPDWIIPDTRFPNESDVINNLPDSFLIKVERYMTCKDWFEYFPKNFTIKSYEGFSDIKSQWDSLKINQGEYISRLKKSNVKYECPVSYYDSIEHESETSLDDYPYVKYVIKNDSDIYELYDKIFDICEIENLV